MNSRSVAMEHCRFWSPKLVLCASRAHNLWVIRHVSTQLRFPIRPESHLHLMSPLLILFPFFSLRSVNGDVDPSEPHNLPNPYPSKNASKATNEAFERAQEERSKRARETMEAARRNADRDRQKQRKQEDDLKMNDFSRQMRELQEKLRQSNQSKDKQWQFNSLSLHRLFANALLWLLYCLWF